MDKSPIILGIDLVLNVLIGPPGGPGDMVVARAEAGAWTPVIIDLALFCAMASVQPGDTIDHARFARLLRHAQFRPTRSREPGEPHAQPSQEEIAHWRDVVFGRDGEVEADDNG